MSDEENVDAKGWFGFKTFKKLSPTIEDEADMRLDLDSYQVAPEVEQQTEAPAPEELLYTFHDLEQKNAELIRGVRDIKAQLAHVPPTIRYNGQLHSVISYIERVCKDLLPVED